MEFPDLGHHCSEATCKQLDFLPLKCDACEELFCKDHITYDQHKCSAAYKKNVLVPVCPLCGTPVPVNKGEMADIAVSQHIDRNCTSSHKQKIFTNRCFKAGCKKKELMKVICDHCHNNFCLSHRHPLDHDCKTGKPVISKSGLAALSRSKVASQDYSLKVNEATKSTRTKTSGSVKSNKKKNIFPGSAGPKVISVEIQNGLNEDEALKKALELSLLETGVNNLLTLSPQDEDGELEQALAASREEYRLFQRKAVKATGK
ncbi:AN1-type zinc finger protein 2A isoform X1 [Xenopus tropicalis]|uniref:AN1-type zinc finger protein 2A isoform X1 n=1 Tax=Xenopus tropicalis TaxID=8364 RepID=Q28DY3_XENTR|nr:AN1-type zinc finger protein 2A isoform X1 [Xenopus tropicalis]CAJ81833.1 novel protein containing AN1-like Zinc finger and Ubiquitin interaction motif [Xenopus tropicalis]